MIGVDSIPRRISVDKTHTRPKDIHLILVLILGVCILQTLFHSVRHKIHLMGFHRMGQTESSLIVLARGMLKIDHVVG